jgi:hypothetical protein
MGFAWIGTLNSSLNTSNDSNAILAAPAMYIHKHSIIHYNGIMDYLKLTYRSSLYEVPRLLLHSRADDLLAHQTLFAFYYQSCQ